MTACRESDSRNNPRNTTLLLRLLHFLLHVHGAALGITLSGKSSARGPSRAIIGQSATYLGITSSPRAGRGYLFTWRLIGAAAATAGRCKLLPSVCVVTMGTRPPLLWLVRTRARGWGLDAAGLVIERHLTYKLRYCTYCERMFWEYSRLLFKVSCDYYSGLWNRKTHFVTTCSYCGERGALVTDVMYIVYACWTCYFSWVFGTLICHVGGIGVGAWRGGPMWITDTKSL